MRYIKPIAAGLALAIAASTFAGTAEARHRHHHHGGGDALAAGVFGFAAGALITGALSQPRYYEQPRYYYAEPVYAEPPVVYEEPSYYQARPEPWSRDWFAYCDSRYRSFNARTGYFLGYDGDYHFCY